jgi:isoamylase
MLSQGIPMILAGDEFGRTQQGNNNAYCQDNEISWVDWGNLNTAGGTLFEFTKRLISLIKQYPILRRSRFLSGQWDEDLGLKDTTWISPSGTEMAEKDWKNSTSRCFGVILDGRAPISGVRRKGSDVTLLLIASAHNEMIKFKLPLEQAVTAGDDYSILAHTVRLSSPPAPRSHAERSPKLVPILLVYSSF